MNSRQSPFEQTPRSHSVLVLSEVVTKHGDLHLFLFLYICEQTHTSGAIPGICYVSLWLDYGGGDGN